MPPKRRPRALVERIPKDMQSFDLHPSNGIAPLRRSTLRDWLTAPLHCTLASQSFFFMGPHSEVHSTIRRLTNSTAAPGASLCCSPERISFNVTSSRSCSCGPMMATKGMPFLLA